MSDLPALARLLHAAYAAVGPPLGPCGVGCGWPDQRHRVADTVAGWWQLGEMTDPEIGDEFGVDPVWVPVIAGRTLAVEAWLLGRRVPKREWGARLAEAWPRQ